VLGIKVEATLRVIRTPAHSGYASFAFPDMESAGKALSEVARTGAAEEAYVFDPETTRKNLATPSDLLKDLKTLGNVVRGEASLLKGLKEGARLVSAGRDFVPEDSFSLHMVCTGRTEGALDADLAACRAACTGLGGTELPNSIPKAVRASLFPEPDGVLGPDGDRWAALNSKVAHSDATRIMRACAATLAPHADEMKAQGIWMSYLLIAIGSTAFSFEPVFHWYDEWLPPHERFPAPATLARFKRPAANPAARALVVTLRAKLVRMFAELGAASNQIGKTYPYMESLEPAGAQLVRALKAAVDPQGRLNPGGLGLRNAE
jgi:FAD/FMN-containing dehydrogenase